MAKAIRLKNNDYLANDYCIYANGRENIECNSREDTSLLLNLSGWWQTNNNNNFELTTNGVKCKFKGAVLIIRSLCTSIKDSEFDLYDKYGVNYMINGAYKTSIAIETVNVNEIKSLSYITGQTNFTL